MKNNFNISGLWVPLITPFYKGKFDPHSMQQLMQKLDPLVDGYIPCLSSGEGERLALSEWVEIITVTSSFTKKPVFAGILGDGIDTIFDRLARSADLPCEGVVLPTIFGSDEENIRFFKQAVSLSKKPVMIYNTEDHSFKSTDSVLELALHEKIIAMKDSSMNGDFFRKLIDLKKKNVLKMSLFQGMEHQLISSTGCDGYVLSLLNTEPNVCRSMFQKADFISQQKIQDLFWSQNLGGEWYVTLKAILYERGLIRSAEQVHSFINPS